MLEWNENSNRETWLGIAGVLAVFALFMTWRLEGFGWLTLWWFWAVCGMVAALLYWQTAREGWLAAGADWVQVGDRWVETYALTEIRTTVVGLRQALTLRDSTNRQLTLPLQAVQGNQPMWDLVYNGLLASITDGATVSNSARPFLALASTDVRSVRDYGVGGLSARLAIWSVVFGVGVVNIVIAISGERSLLACLGAAIIAIALWAGWKTVAGYRLESRND